ncbi:MAG: ABC transporter substrate-binding protein [Lachnospiraceae bacterium]|nr:ABC transporter substrate-binding protein [Lachnospiraceae bacterium]
MKKFLAIALSVVMTGMLLTGCSTSKTENNGAEDNSGKAEVTQQAQVTPADKEDTAAKENAQPEGIAPAEDTEKEIVRVAALKGPTSMGMVQLMDEDAKKENAEYAFTIAGAVDEITPLLVKGEVDIAAVPANLASVLYNNTKGEVEVLAINTLGVIYIVESGDSVQSVADLKGKTIYASGKGATPEYALNYILEKNGINPEKDVTIEWKSEHAECVAALASTENGIAMLPQPFVTTAQMKNDTIRIALDLTAEWDAVQENEEVKSSLLTGVVVARREFVKNNKEAVDAFLDSYKASVDYVNANTKEAAAMIESFDIIAAQVAEKALPYCNITYIDGADMKEKLSGYLNVLYTANPQSVGGNLPNDDFYYSR